MLETNEYFDGTVKSIAFKTETCPATVGVMLPGNYVFNTADKEKMTIVSGGLTLKLASDDKEQVYTTGESFEVEANSSFDVKVTVETAYLCLYIKD